MAIQSSPYSGTGLTTRTFPSSKHIPTKAHMAVWRKITIGQTWEQVSSSEYQLIANSCVLNALLNITIYDAIEIRVADTPDELGDSISDISLVADNIASVNTVATNIDNINTLAGINAAISSLYADKVTLDSLYADKATLDSIYADKITLDSLYADKATLDSIYADKITLDSLYADKATLDSLFADKAKLDSLFADKATLDSLYADKITLDSLYADKASLDAIYANLTEILAASGYAASASASATAAAASAVLAASYVPNPMDMTLTGDTTGVELAVVVITDTDYNASANYVPSVSAGSVVDNADGTYDVTLPDYSVATSISFTLGGELIGYDDNLKSHVITVTNTILTAPVFTGSPVTGEEETVVVITNTAHDGTYTYVDSVDFGSVVDNGNGTFSVTLPAFGVATLDSVELSVYATKAGDITSSTTTWDIAVTEVTIIADTAVTYSSTEFTTTNY
ncbi:hypothetical protein OAE88_00680 [bacterium]|nr:hypothetical protein [bacterium]